MGFELDARSVYNSLTTARTVSANRPIDDEAVGRRRPLATVKSMTQANAKIRTAKFQIGQVVRHRVYPFRGVVFDVDPTFNNTEEWWASIPEEVRPRKDQPFYHLYAENAETEYVAYVSEQNLVIDDTGEPLRHPQVAASFEADGHGGFKAKELRLN
jgi:heat shock protein HspQ